jgi:hypothetical protein
MTGGSIKKLLKHGLAIVKVILDVNAGVLISASLDKTILKWAYPACTL